jgi:hypothetical protein
MNGSFLWAFAILPAAFWVPLIGNAEANYNCTPPVGISADTIAGAFCT